MTVLELLEFLLFGWLAVFEVIMVFIFWALFSSNQTRPWWKVVFAILALALTVHLGWTVRG